MTTEDRIEISRGTKLLFSQKRSELRGIWAELTHQMQRLRDNPECADQEFEAKKDPENKGFSAHLTYDINEDIAAPYIATGKNHALRSYVNKGLTVITKWQRPLTVQGLKRLTYI